jgi:LacI family transcriptional regulator
MSGCILPAEAGYPRRRRARPTITDVARLAGVSTGTVSHVLNGSRDVSIERRDRVMQAIEALGYVPNLLAQNLRRKRARMVGLCMPHAVSGYFVTLSERLEELAAADGYDMLHVFTRYDGSAERQRIETLLRYDIGGVLLLPSWQPEATLDRLAMAEVPTVILDRPADDPRFDQVTVDATSAMRHAAQELVSLGHRRIAFISAMPEILISRRRLLGLRDGIRGAQGDIRLMVVQRPEDPAAFDRVLADLMRGPDRPTALVITSSQGMVQVVKAIRALGLVVPRDASLVSVNQPAWAEVVTPPLAGVRPPAHEIAEQAWSLLLARMQGRSLTPTRIALEPEFCREASIGPAPAP